MAGTGLLVCLTGLFLSIRKRQRKPVVKEDEKTKPNSLSVEEILAPAYFHLAAEDKNFYSSLHGCIWNYFRQQVGLSGSDMNKNSLKRKLEKKKMSQDHIDKVLDILQLCETGMFTNVLLTTDKTELLNKTNELLGLMNISLL
jgi:hypothetical protein